MIFSIPFLIEWCSAAFTLHPGDVILTGTPPGVGAYMNPPGLLQPGDVVRVEIESIGSMENNVVAESGQA
jgi:2-keto-4-pentenoate hydratase/2-oxohepta-3-ene-1,7-dioic acid hydratase in catechol pathway